MDVQPHEIQAKAVIAAALIQARAVILDVGVLTGGTDESKLQQLRASVDRIYNALIAS